MNNKKKQRINTDFNQTLIILINFKIFQTKCKTTDHFKRKK